MLAEIQSHKCLLNEVGENSKNVADKKAAKSAQEISARFATASNMAKVRRDQNIDKYRQTDRQTDRLSSRQICYRFYHGKGRQRRPIERQRD